MKAAAEVPTLKSYTYDAFGKPTIKDGSGSTISSPMQPFLFTGREYDGETKLYHYRTRAYSTELGRFLQPDSIGFGGGDINLFRYVANNPIIYVDPEGRLLWHGNWGGPNWVNGQRKSEMTNFPRQGDPGWKKPVDAEDWCYYYHDVALRECAKIRCPDLRKECRKKADNDLSSCLSNIPGWGRTWWQNHVSSMFSGNLTPNNNAGGYYP